MPHTAACRSGCGASCTSASPTGSGPGRASADEMVGYHLEQAWRLAARARPAGPARPGARARGGGSPRRRRARGAAARRRRGGRRAARAGRGAGRGGGSGARRPAVRARARRSSRPAGSRTPTGGSTRRSRSPPPTATRASAARPRRARARAPARGTGGGRRGARDRRAALAELERHGDELGAAARGGCGRGSSGRRAGPRRRTRHGGTRRRTRGRAGDERELLEILGWRASAAVSGPTPVPEAIRRCEGIREQVAAQPRGRRRRAAAARAAARDDGRLRPARQLVHEANAMLDELGRMEDAVSHHEALVELLAGRPDEAEARLRPGYEELADGRARRARHDRGAAGRGGARPGPARRGRRAVRGERADRRHPRTSRRRRCGEACGRDPRPRGRARRGGGARPRGGAARRADGPARRPRRRAARPRGGRAHRGARTAEARAAAGRALELYERKGNSVSAALARSWLEAGNGSGKTLATVPRP